jgi:hypothetical protein
VELFNVTVPWLGESTIEKLSASELASEARSVLKAATFLLVLIEKLKEMGAALEFDSPVKILDVAIGFVQDERK